MVDELIRLLGVENVKFDPEELEKYSHDETSGVEAQIPLAVVFPTSTEQVSMILRWANERRVPIVPRGAGTGLSAGAVPTKDSIVVSLERMNRIVEFDEENMTITVEPGVITGEIQKIAEEHGLFYAGDPASSEFFHRWERCGECRRCQGHKVRTDVLSRARSGSRSSNR